MNNLPACPYCNALVGSNPGTPAGQRVVCPRCEEPFVLHEDIPNDATTSPADTPKLDRDAINVPARRSNRLVAAAVLGVMATMALVGLTFAWWTKDYRRGNDQGLKESTRRSGVHQGQPLPPLEAVLAPLQMPAVGYVPAGYDVVAGIHVGELLRAAREKSFRDDLTVKLGPITLPLGKLLAARPAGIDEVDDVVAGMKAEEPLSALLVVRTRMPFELARIVGTLGAERAGGNGKTRVYYRFHLQKVDFLRKVQLPAFLWCPDERTLVFTLAESALEAVPAAANSDGEQLSAELRELLRDRVEPTAHLWLAGHVDDWRKTALPALLDQADAAGMKELLALRSFGAWVFLERDNVTLRLALKSQDEAGGQRLEKLLTPGAGEGQGEIKSHRDGKWVTLQYRLRLVADR